MERRTGNERVEITASTEGEIRRAAREHLERVGGVSGRGKPGRVSREGRPRLRGAPAAAAVMEGRR